MTVYADDGFAGAGGWDVACEALGIRSRGIEIMPAARATREAAGLVTVHDDVWTHEPDGLATLRIDSPPCQTFSAAGSGSGRKALDDVLRGIRDGYVRDRDHLRFLGLEVGDERTSLVLLPLHYALTYDYDALAWEQVPAVLPVWEACAEVLRAAGWHVWTGFVYSEQHGVAQTRKRAVLRASRRHPVGPPRVTHSRYHHRTPERLDPGVLPWVTMAQALAECGLGPFGLSDRPAPTITGGGTETGGAEPIAKLARYTTRPGWIFRSGNRANATMRSIDEPAPTIIAGNDTANRVWEQAPEGRWILRNNNTANAAERDLDQPAPTLYFGQRVNYCAFERRETPEAMVAAGITGEGRPRDVGAPAPTMTGKGTAYWLGAVEDYRSRIDDAPSKRRNDGLRVTVAEAGVLQSFHPAYPWTGNQGEKYLQVGNSVPPLMALAILEDLTD